MRVEGSRLLSSLVDEAGIEPPRLKRAAAVKSRVDTALATAGEAATTAAIAPTISTVMVSLGIEFSQARGPAGSPGPAGPAGARGAARVRSSSSARGRTSPPRSSRSASEPRSAPSL